MLKRFSDQRLFRKALAVSESILNDFSSWLQKTPVDAAACFARQGQRFRPAAGGSEVSRRATGLWSWWSGAPKSRRGLKPWAQDALGEGEWPRELL